MAGWIVCVLCALIIIKPQEFVPALADAPLVYVAFGAALAGIVMDIVWRRLRPALAPQVPFVLAFLAWSLSITALKRPDAIAETAVSIAILAGVFLSVAIGAGSPSGLRAFATMFLGTAALVTAVALHQSRAPFGCFLAEPDDWRAKEDLRFDGRPCESVLDCEDDPAVPGGTYRCERVGLLDTSSLEGRVRYRGSLSDPNELALTISIAVPLALGLAGARRARSTRSTGSTGSIRSKHRRPPASLPPLPVNALIAAIGLAVILSQSRTGLLVFLLVLGLGFIRKMGLWGVAVGCFVGPSMFLLGGRDGTEADESLDERVSLLREGIELIRATWGVGIGKGQFSSESSIGMNAHNAYLLAASEAGIVGLFLFGIAVYLSLKVPYVIWFGDYDIDARLTSMAQAIAIAVSGAAVGVFFLSWAYKDILYMMFGASSALYAAARAEDPRLRVRLSIEEAALVCAAMVGLVGAIYVLTRLHQ
jgi:O-Antigen ligase